MNQGTGRPRKQGGPWTTAENERLRALVGRYAHKAQVHWVEIAREHGTRDAKQCRERWDNHLKPGLNRDKISDTEGHKLLQWVSQHGKHWAPLGRLVNRPENMVKNFFYQENKKAERGITKHRRHASRQRASRSGPSSSVPMSRDNSASSSRQSYGSSSTPAMYAPAPTEYGHAPTDYSNHRETGPYYQPASHYAPYQYPSRRTSVASVMTNPPSLTPDHGSPAESPRAGTEIPYPPGQFTLPPYPQPIEIPMISPQDLAEGAGHKRSNSASSYDSFAMAHPHSPSALPIRTGFLDRQRQAPAQAPATFTPAFSERWPAQPAPLAHPSPRQNAEHSSSNSRKGSDTRMNISNLLS
ncbi:putative trichome differentiation protein gl1 [Diaporthe ampelina]|uniref:Putative trichome differentiation protein gl1 n=1 Tax=Diaporthe ampelina TaxID=1214573 RepID=A0A0G2F5Z0_9PEZI|nr:putative trichome differentiation protein gl1 [Diaporthe ampelina]